MEEQEPLLHIVFKDGKTFIRNCIMFWGSTDEGVRLVELNRSVGKYVHKNYHIKDVILIERSGTSINLQTKNNYYEIMELNA